MAIDFQDAARQAFTGALEAAVRSVGTAGQSTKSSGGKLSGVAKVAGAAALVPLAAKGMGKLAGGDGEGLGRLFASTADTLKNAASDAGEGVGSGLADKLGDKLDENMPGGILGSMAKGLLPFGGGGDGGGNGGVPGVGKGRRMPVQQSVDIGVGIETVYNQFTQFEQWPEFMHRVTRVTQEDDCTLSFAVKIWAKTKEFTAKIETQRPDQRIKWKVSQGITHTGVVTFHELGPNLTRVLVGMDMQPGGPLEKVARGMRHLKRAVRADLHRFKAFIEISEQETGAWRGVIEDGEVVEDHDPAYDEERSYADIEDLIGEEEEEEEEEEDEEEEEGEPEDYEEEDFEGDEEEEFDEEQEEDFEEDEDEPARVPPSRGRGAARRRGGRSTGRSRERRSSGHGGSRGDRSRRSGTGS